METRSSLRLLLSTYPFPLSFFTKDIVGSQPVEAQLSSSATAGDNDNSRPPKSCKMARAVRVVLVETVGKKQQHPKVGDTPYSFQHTSPTRI